MEDDPFANVEPEFRHMVPKAIDLLDRCKRETGVDADKVLPVVASTDAEMTEPAREASA